MIARKSVARGLALGLAIGALAACALLGPPPAPRTRIENVTETLHGVEVTDPYRWLEDQESPETREWIDRQNEYTHSLLDKFKGRPAIAERLTELIKIDSVGSPIARAGRYFFSKRGADDELSIIYMRQGLGGADQLLIDPHPMSPDHTTSVGILDVSDDGALLVYSVRQGGEDEIAVRVLDVERREHLPDRLERARYFGLSFVPDRSGFYYTRHDEQGPRVYFHVLGEPIDTDRYVFGEGLGAEKIAYAEPSENGRHLLISVLFGSAGRTELYYRNLVSGEPTTPIVTGVDARFSGEFAGDRLFIRTDWRAPNGRIVNVDPAHPAPENWRDFLAERDSVIEAFSLAGGKVFVSYLENVVTHVKIFEPDGSASGEIALDAPGSAGVPVGRWDSDEAFFSFSSFHLPRTIYRYDVSSGNREVWARLAVPIDSERFEVKQVWYRSKDSTPIPMFLVHKKGLKLDGRNPTLLTGYGGFNISLTPNFSPRAALWVERGGVFAQPNLRGGAEFGEAWHVAGMLEAKQNVFDDFIAAAEWLIENEYTNPRRLAISGGSNGGLLVGAALTQRPELFQAVVCSVPLLDMIRYHRFLVASFWVPEYGSSEDPEQFEFIHAYSPYHRVQWGAKYPAVLFTTGDSDTRVAPLHARKMTALLQAATGSRRPIVLLYDTKAGHSGGKPANKVIEDLADELSFLFWQLDVR